MIGVGKDGVVCVTVFGPTILQWLTKPLNDE